MEGFERVSRLQRWTDGDGVEWVRRGEAVESKRVERLILSPTARVLRFGRADVIDVPAEARVAYWHQVGPSIRGKVHRVVGQKTQDHFDCEVAEFRDAERRILVVVYESADTATVGKSR